MTNRQRKDRPTIVLMLLMKKTITLFLLYHFFSDKNRTFEISREIFRDLYLARLEPGDQKNSSHVKSERTKRRLIFPVSFSDKFLI